MADGTRPFLIGPRLARLTGAYPSPPHVLEAAAEGPREKAILARLWISEGIPFAFKQCPGLYEELRQSLAERLGLDAKQISVAGGGRLGYSLAPKKWGQAYESVASDLDLFTVSDGLFQRLCADFERWSEDFARGDVQPRNRPERRYWQANQEETPRNMRRGFIGSNRVPNLEPYAAFLAVNGCLADLRIRLHRVDEGPKPRHRLTLRCYRDWSAYERQTAITLNAVVDWSLKASPRA